MDAIMRRQRGAGGFTKQEIKAINRCRRYLNVITLSDISNGNGTRLLRWAMECSKQSTPAHFSGMQYKWPKHGKPSARDRAIWKEALIMCFCRSYNGSLRDRLGKWNNDTLHLTKWRYNPANNRIYNLGFSGRWRHWRPAYDHTTRNRHFIAADWVRVEEVADATAIPVVQNLSMGYCKFEHYGEVSRHNEITHRFDLCRNELIHSKEFGWAFHDVNFNVPLDVIADYIRHNQGKFATDGTTVDGKSSSGFLMFTETDDDLLDGGNHVAGRKEDQNSFRAEGAGILALILLLNYICEKYNINAGRVEVICDSSSALTTAFGSYEISCNEPSHDIYRRIIGSLEKSPLTFSPTWVKGHQNRKKPYEQLDFKAKAKCRADKIAEHFMASHPGNNNIDNEFEHSAWALELNGEVITSNLKHTLYYHCTAPAIKKYWSEKHYFDEKPIEGVAWKSFEMAAKKIPCKQRRWLTKHFAHNSATGLVMQWRGERDDPKCPLCDVLVENTDHLLCCDGKDMEETFTTSLEKMQIWVRKTSEKPIADVITEFFLSTRDQRDFEFNPLWGEDVHALAQKQLEYGQRAMVHGFLIKEWKEWHASFILDTPTVEGAKSPPPDKWVADLIQHIWDINFDLWCKRCELAHGKEENRVILYNGATVDDDLKDLYNSLPHPRLMNASERNIFSVPLRKVLAHPVKRKLRYLRRSKRILDNYRLRVGSLVDRGRI